MHAGFSCFALFTCSDAAVDTKMPSGDGPIIRTAHVLDHPREWIDAFNAIEW